MSIPSQFGIQPVLQKLYVPKDVSSSSVVFVTEATKIAAAVLLIVLDGQVCGAPLPWRRTYSLSERAKHQQ